MKGSTFLLALALFTGTASAFVAHRSPLNTPLTIRLMSEEAEGEAEVVAEGEAVEEEATEEENAAEEAAAPAAIVESPDGLGIDPGPLGLFDPLNLLEDTEKFARRRAVEVSRPLSSTTCGPTCVPCLYIIRCVSLPPANSD